MTARHLGVIVLCVSALLPSSARADGDSQRTWGWVATGAGVGFLGVGAYSYFEARSYADDAAFTRFRETEVPAGEDACTFAEAKGREDIVDVCDGSDNWGTAFWITLPLGIVLTGTGVYLLATAPSQPVKAGWQLGPRTSPRGGRLELTYRF